MAETKTVLVRYVGTSHVVTVPKDLLQALGWAEGQRVRVGVAGGKLVVEREEDECGSLQKIIEDAAHVVSTWPEWMQKGDVRK